MKSITTLYRTVVACALLATSLQLHAGRYDGLSEVFNRAVKNIDPPPPRDLTLENTAPGFDPPGLHGPDIRMPKPDPLLLTPPARTLTEEFNANSFQ